MKQITHVGATTDGQNEAFGVKLAKWVAAVEPDFYAYIIRVDHVIIIVCFAETRVVGRRCRRRCQQHVQRIDALVGCDQGAVDVVLLRAASVDAASATLQRAIKACRAPG